MNSNGEPSRALIEDNIPPLEFFKPTSRHDAALYNHLVHDYSVQQAQNQKKKSNKEEKNHLKSIGEYKEKNKLLRQKVLGLNKHIRELDNQIEKIEEKLSTEKDRNSK